MSTTRSRRPRLISRRQAHLKRVPYRVPSREPDTPRKRGGHGHRLPIRWDDLTPRRVKEKREEGENRTLYSTPLTRARFSSGPTRVGIIGAG
jgi:hypothetical protein